MSLVINVEKNIVLDEYGNADITRYVILTPTEQATFDNEYLWVTEDKLDVAEIKIKDNRERDLKNTIEKANGKTLIKYWPDTTIQPGEIYKVIIHYKVPRYAIKFSRLNAWTFQDKFSVSDITDWPFPVDSHQQFSIKVTIPDTRRTLERFYKSMVVDALQVAKETGRVLEWVFNLGPDARSEDLYVLYIVKTRDKLLGALNAIITALVVGLITYFFFKAFITLSSQAIEFQRLFDAETYLFISTQFKLKAIKPFNNKLLVNNSKLTSDEVIHVNNYHVKAIQKSSGKAFGILPCCKAARCIACRLSSCVGITVGVKEKALTM